MMTGTNTSHELKDHLYKPRNNCRGGGCQKRRLCKEFDIAPSSLSAFQACFNDFPVSESP